MSTYTPEQIEATLTQARAACEVFARTHAVLPMSDLGVAHDANRRDLIAIIEQLRAENARLHKREDAIREIAEKSDCASPIEVDEIYAILDGDTR